MKLKINNVKGYSGVIEIATDKNGIPLNKFWRNRIADSKVDKCVEILKSTKRKEKAE